MTIVMGQPGILGSELWFEPQLPTMVKLSRKAFPLLAEPHRSYGGTGPDFLGVRVGALAGLRSREVSGRAETRTVAATRWHRQHLSPWRAPVVLHPTALEAPFGLFSLQKSCFSRGSASLESAVFFGQPRSAKGPVAEFAGEPKRAESLA